jgi:hypothetical protein
LHATCNSDKEINDLLSKSLTIVARSALAAKKFIELSATIERLRNGPPTAPAISPSDLNSRESLSEFNKIRVQEALSKSLVMPTPEIDNLEEQLAQAYQMVTSPLQVAGQRRNRWTNIEVTPEERESYRQKLQNRESHIYKCGYFNGNNLSDESRTGDKLEAQDLSNGKTLEVEELQAIRLFSTQFYKILNQGLRNHPNDFPIALKELDTPIEFADEMRNVAIECSTIISSGLNKLPPYEGLLMRGTALRVEDMERYQEGNIFVENKFSGGSVDILVCVHFAKGTAETYPGCIPAIMCWESKSSKSIQDYSLLPAEAERLYPPGQGFQVLKVEEGREELTGFKIICMKELNIA